MTTAASGTATAGAAIDSANHIESALSELWVLCQMQQLKSAVCPRTTRGDLKPGGRVIGRCYTRAVCTIPGSGSSLM